MSQDFRLMSRDTWTAEVATVENINCGSLQRIADAVEKMGARYTQMEKDLAAAVKDRDTYRDWCRERGAQIDKLNRRVSALKGWAKRRAK
jgi:archaellum component FlaC